MKKNNMLKDIYNPKNNSFTILSILLSLIIIYYHCYDLYFGAINKPIDIFSKLFIAENTGSIVVASFFVISGFMITFSIKRSDSIFKYLKKRVVRIYPALILTLFMTVFIIAPVMASLPKEEVLTHSIYYKDYLLNNLLLTKNTVYGILDVFANNPYPNAINGSIWTIKHQMFTYLYMIPVFLAFIKKDSNKEYYKYFFFILLIFTAVSYTGHYDELFNSIRKNFGSIGILNEINQLVRLIYYFSAGVFLNIYADKISYNSRNILLSIITLILTARTSIFNYVALVLIPYLIIYIGCKKSSRQYIDISYYIYLIGFPVQQVIIHYLKNINFYIYIALSLIISLLIGYIMYILISYFPKQLLKIYKKRGET